MKTHLQMHPFCLKNVVAALAAGSVLALAGCGGSSGGITSASTAPAAAPITLSGTAAGGAAIAGGAVNAKCATGSGTATTAADGSYTLTVTGIAPCMLQVTDPTNAAKVYYSAVPAGATTANITPLTSLVVANAIGADPATAYTSFSSTTQAAITSTAITTAVSNVSTALAGIGVSIPAGTNPVTATFTAATETKAGSALDQQIDALAAKLANANVPLSTLVTTMATNSTSATAVSSAVTTLATNSGISSSTLTVPASGTAAAATCPYATSGKYLGAGLGDNSITQYSIDFKALTAQNVAANKSFTITTGVDPNNPCAYTFSNATQTVNVRVSQSGLSAFSSAALPTTAATSLATSSVGLVLPAPTTTFALADFAGTWNAVQWDQAVGVTYWNSTFSQLVIDNAGNLSYYVCSGATSCATTPSMTHTISGPDAAGVFTVTGSDGSKRNFAIYRSANGDMVGFGVLVSSTSYNGQYFVFSKRVSAPIVRTVGSSFSLVDWRATNNNTTGPQQTATPKTFTVTAATPLTNNTYSFTRQDNADSSTDSVQVNQPRVGMLTHPAVAATATLAAKPLWYGVNGIGWTIFGTATTGVPNSNTNPVFFGISIQTPNQ